MTRIPTKIRKEIATDSYYKACALHGIHGHECGGRITLEHAIIHTGKQVQEKWAIIPICAQGHEVDEYQDAHTMKKDLNIWIALNRATDDELRAVSKAVDYIHVRRRLNEKYGEYRRRDTSNELALDVFNGPSGIIYVS